MRTRFLGSYTNELPAPTVPEVAFVGRSNVGKSSAINRLLESPGLARTSNTPGRTQTINLFIVEERWAVADLPGYGYARVSKDQREAWQIMIESYLQERPALVVSLIDGRLPPQELDRQLLAYIAAIGRPRLVLATKMDDIKLPKRAGTLAELARGHGLKPDEILGFSSTEDIGWEAARKRIRAAVR